MCLLLGSQNKSPSQLVALAGAKFSIPTSRTQSESLNRSQLKQSPCHGLFNSSGSLTILAAIRRASSLVMRLAAARRPGSCDGRLPLRRFSRPIVKLVISCSDARRHSSQPPVGSFAFLRSFPCIKQTGGLQVLFRDSVETAAQPLPIPAPDRP